MTVGSVKQNSKVDWHSPIRMERQFYLHLSSKDSMQYFLGNDTSRFTVKLPEILHLNGQWEVALCEIGLPKAKPQPNKLLVCSEICNESICEKRLPLLRVVTGRIPASFRTLQYTCIFALQLFHQFTIFYFE